MFKKTGVLTLYLTLTFLTLACQEEFEFFEGGDFSLRLNQPKTLVDGSVIELTNIEDSRCPEGAQCAWEGRSAVILRWKRDAAYNIQLNDVEYPSELIEQYLITLVEVMPFPTIYNSNQEKLVRITIEIN